MRRFVALTATAALCAALFAPAPAQAMSDKEKKALAAFLAIGIAIAAAKTKGDDAWDDDRYEDAFSPGSGVTCLPNPRQCYLGGKLSYKWTKRVFGN